MGAVLGRLRGMRGLEWLLLAAALAAVLLMMSGGEQQRAESTALEMRMESVLSCVAGAGQVRVLINGAQSAAFEETPATGVVVVAEGADDLRVAMELQKAVQALTGLAAERIEVLGMEDVP